MMHQKLGQFQSNGFHGQLAVRHRDV